MQGYQLGSSQLDFAITITVTSTTNATNAATVTESLQLDPSDPFVLDDANLVSAELLGDLLTYTALPVFTDTYLMIPSPTGAHLSSLTADLRLLTCDMPLTYQPLCKDSFVCSRHHKHCSQVASAFQH